MPTTNASKFLMELPQNLVLTGGNVEKRLLPEYGAVFMARGGALPPDRMVFADDGEVREFQERAGHRRAAIGGYELELQPPAMDALLAAVEAAKSEGLEIGPRGADSARRSYEETVTLWKSRVEPALEHWVREGRIEAEEADYLRSLPPAEQIEPVFALEEKGIWFAKDLSKSIIYSVAPPGTSQHLSMLAFDVKEFADPRVREILTAHGWFQTVVSDLPHFTFLGMPEYELPAAGLIRVLSGEQAFWVPDLASV